MVASNMDHRITSKQLIFILIGGMVGTGIISLGRVTAKIIEQDAWVAVFLGGILPLISLTLIEKVCSKHKSLTFLPLMEKLLGKILGRLFAVFFACYSLLSAAVIVRIFIEIISMFLLSVTPMIVKIVLMLSACTYLACQSAKILGRVFEFMFYILFPLILLILPTAFTHGDVLNLMPVLNHKLPDYAKAALSTALAFSGFETYLIYYAFVVKKEEAYKASLIALGFTIGLYFFVVISTILVFGAGLSQAITWPTLRLIATAEVPVLERIEFVFLQAWVGVAFRPICSQLFCSSYIIAEIFSMKSHKNVVLGLAPVVALAAWLPKDIYQVFKIADYVGYLSLIMGIILPLILIIASLFVTRKGVKSVETK